MLQPIQKEHEYCCPGCGAVLAQIQDSNNDRIEVPKITSINLHFLGSALERNVKYDNRRDRDQIYEERVLRKLNDVVKQYSLPERLAMETFNKMKKKNRGFRSETEWIKQLINLLSRDENYIYINKLKLIKARYENTSA